MDRRKLPVGIQTFRRIREGHYYYVDKTPWMLRLVEDASVHHLLSRPRRFGKTLFVDTLKELFEGNEPLFEGLAIHERWDWSVSHPVLRFSFARGDFGEPGFLQRNLATQLDAMEGKSGVEAGYPDASERFAHLLETLHERTGQRVVVLVDEYDKPILDALGDSGLARANRNFLRGLYSTVKDCEDDIEFSFLTGVTKCALAGLFSGMNNPRDVTLNPRYSAICGYTDADLDTVFAPELEGLDRAAIREWYNGYSWLGDEKIYNPFGILGLFDERGFGAWWFETGTPSFLVDVLEASGMVSRDLEDMWVGARLLSAFDVDDIEPAALLFQTGHLTIVEKDDSAEDTAYRLGCPNREVREGLNRILSHHRAPTSQASEKRGP